MLSVPLSAMSGDSFQFQNGLWEKLLMWWIERELVVWIAVSVQVLGIAGVILARLNGERTWPRLCGWAVLACFVLVGLASIATMRACGSCWLVFATTLPLMAVGATLDLRKSEYSAGF